MNRKKERVLRQRVRKLVREEVSPDVKSGLEDAMTREVRKTLDDILMRHNVEQKGLSKGQVGYLFRKVVDEVRDVLDDYETIRVRDNDLNKAREDYVS
jgi:hypothetical protein